MVKLGLFQEYNDYLRTSTSVTHHISVLKSILLQYTEKSHLISNS